MTLSDSLDPVIGRDKEIRRVLQNSFEEEEEQSDFGGISRYVICQAHYISIYILKLHTRTQVSERHPSSRELQ